MRRDQVLALAWGWRGCSDWACDLRRRIRCFIGSGGGSIGNVVSPLPTHAGTHLSVRRGNLRRLADLRQATSSHAHPSAPALDGPNACFLPSHAQPDPVALNPSARRREPQIEHRLERAHSHGRGFSLWSRAKHGRRVLIAPRTATSSSIRCVWRHDACLWKGNSDNGLPAISRLAG